MGFSGVASLMVLFIIAVNGQIIIMPTTTPVATPIPEAVMTENVTAMDNGTATNVTEPMTTAPLETANTTTARLTTSAILTTAVPVPEVIPNNCNVTVLAGMNCIGFDSQLCGAGTRYDISKCVCNHLGDVNPITCTSDLVFIPNKCNVKVLAGNGCLTFGGQKCGAGTIFDIHYCVCNHANMVNTTTCSSVPQL